ncbi:unnamed protein product [Albugo candida]|uniref:Uncharacterized protein n=1 Tax=Albugo candida TaxID=65357 RepID=A0A024GNV4_9STRA|nr:unnamed protein product [Albugo candida]|eukprot:CCI48027.1 unnamed protein product [Albugo candida]
MLCSPRISMWLRHHFFNMFYFQHFSIGDFIHFCLAGVIIQPNQDLELLQSRCWNRFRHKIRRHPAVFQVGGHLNNPFFACELTNLNLTSTCFDLTVDPSPPSCLSAS